MTDEAHFSAKQPCPRASSWLPLADGHTGRTCSDPGASVARTRQAVGLTTLTKRSDFLAANAGKRAPMPGFVLLVRERCDGDFAMRVGYTVTRKIGNAVVRNRMKRRFRELARALLPLNGLPGADHVLIGRAGGIERDFQVLRCELEKALRRVVR